MTPALRLALEMRRFLHLWSCSTASAKLALPECRWTPAYTLTLARKLGWSPWAQDFPTLWREAQQDATPLPLP